MSMTRMLKDETMEMKTRKECLDASDLGWAPGYWPIQFTDHGRIFYRSYPMGSNGEFKGYVYSGVEELGSRSTKIYLSVYND